MIPTILILSLLGPFIPSLITLSYYLNPKTHLLTKKLIQPQWLLQLPIVLIPIHYLAILIASQTKQWLVIGVVIGLIHATFGRYWFDLPGKLWLHDDPEKIYLVAISLWSFIYLTIHQTILK